MGKREFSLDVLKLDCDNETARITQCLEGQLEKQLKRRGVVVALSGGIDSSLVGALCVKAFGAKRVYGLMMPERDSSPETRRLSQLIVDHLGIAAIEEDITPMLEAVGCYTRRDGAIKSVIPDYDASYKCKIVLPSLLEGDRLNIFSVVVEAPDGIRKEARLTPSAYLGIVAATNFKQRVRKMLEYYHADRLNYAVTGTPNMLEYDQGFFVKLGDGAADVKPIAHLYKTQVYELARFLELPTEICDRPPTTDTYTMQQSQEEFYFAVPYETLDICLYGKNNNFAPKEVADALRMTTEQIERVYRDIETKRRTTQYLHTAPLLIS
jgi:NAD+ synthase